MRGAPETSLYDARNSQDSHTLAGEVSGLRRGASCSGSASGGAAERRESISRMWAGRTLRRKTVCLTARPMAWIMVTMQSSADSRTLLWDGCCMATCLTRVPVGVLEQCNQAPEDGVALADGQLGQAKLPRGGTKHLCHALPHAPVFVRPDRVDCGGEAGGSHELQKGDHQRDGLGANRGCAFAHAGHHWCEHVGGEAAEALALRKDDDVQNVQRVALDLCEC